MIHMLGLPWAKKQHSGRDGQCVRRDGDSDQEEMVEISSKDTNRDDGYASGLDTRGRLSELEDGLSRHLQR